MNQRALLLVLPALALGLVAARKPGEAKYEHRFLSESTPSAVGVSLQLVKAESQKEFVAVDTKLTNSSTDRMLVVKRGEAAFVVGGQRYSPKAGGLFGGPIFLEPGATKTLGYKAEGGTDFHVQAMSLQLTGIYAAAAKGAPVEAPPFVLPASTNEFTAGPYTCKLKNVDLKTDHSAAAFACDYNGMGLGIVEPSRIGVREPGGQEFANVARSAPRDVLLPGDTSKFTVWFEIPAKVADMQFATLTVLFRDALTESPLTPVPLPDWAFTLDEAATKAANK